MPRRSVVALDAAQITKLIPDPKNVRVPKNAFVVTYSEMDAYRQCPLKHQWGYKDGWSKEAVEGSALSRGSLWHEVLEVHYKTIQKYRGQVPTDDLLDLCRYNVAPLMFDEAGRQSEQQELITWMYNGHVEMWEDDPDVEILAVEVPGRVRVRNPDTGKPTRFFYQFKIDLIVRVNGVIYLWDHKSAADFTRENEMDIDDQFGLYTAFLRQVGIPIFGTIKSEARTRRLKTKEAPLTDRFRRTHTYRSDVELVNIQRDLLATASAAYLNRPDTRLHSSPDPRQCSWKCDFMGVHLATRKGMPLAETMRDYGLHQRDEKHREYAETDLPIHGPGVLPS